MRLHVGKAIAAALLSAGFACSAMAQAYPSRTVRVIIPAAPGGAADTLGRLLASKLSTATGQSFVPENVPGAGTMIASDQLARSTPDGYTILLVTSSHAINAAIKKHLPYDPVKDFATVSLVATLPDLLLVNPKVPVKSVAELLALARQQPGKITFGSAGSGSGTDMDAELFKSMANVDLLHIPYKGGTPAVAALVAGQISMMFSNPVSSLSLVRSGRLRALAISSKVRSPLLPDVPTVSESGVPGYESQSWYGVLAPAKTPADVVAALNREVTRALALPDVDKQITSVGGVVAPSSPQEFAAYMSDDINRWRKLVSETPALQAIRVTLAMANDDVYAMLRDLILREEVLPNERLIESVYAERFGTNRSSIRKALADLEREGLVVIEPFKGAHVRRITDTEAIEMTEVRSALESLLVRYAAQRAGDQDKVNLRQALSQAKALLEQNSPIEVGAAARRVRERMWEMSGHATGHKILATINSQLIRIWFHAILMPGRAEEIVDHLDRVVDAICVNDPDAAVAAMHTYHEKSMAALIKAVQRAGARNRAAHSGTSLAR